MKITEKEILTKKVKQNITAVRKVLDRQVSQDDLTGVQEKLIDLVEVAGLASYTESIAKAIYDQELSEALEIMAQDPVNAKLGSNNLLAVARGKVSAYQSMVVYSERLGRNISHAIDGLRTIISLHKQEMTNYEST